MNSRDFVEGNQPTIGSALAEAALDCYIEQARTDWSNIGLAVAVVRDSEVIYARGFGVRQFGEAARIDVDTLFQIGSTTKAFTTAALGILGDEEKIDWDDPVIDYLPGFQLQDPWLTRNLTIRDTVTHRSGVSGSSYPFLGIKDSDESVRQLRYATPAAAFRNSFIYDNLMYAVAGKVLEAASGMTWRDFIRQRLLQPLKMNRSGTSPYEFWDARYVAPTFLGSVDGAPNVNKARDNNLAMPHVRRENGAPVVLPWRSYDNAAAAGAIVSSVADMANWLIMHLNEGRFEGRQLLKRETMREMHSRQNLHAGLNQFPFDKETESYAMGWWRAEYHGYPHLAHSGGMIGFPAYAALLPDRKVGVAVLSNSPKIACGDYAIGYLFHKSIAFWVIDRLLGAAPRDWSKEFLSRAHNALGQAQIEEMELRQSRLANAPSLHLERYAGEYVDHIGHSGLVSVCVENGVLTLKFAGEGAYSAQLEHWHQDLFRLHSHPGVMDSLGRQFAAFSIDPGGKVISMSAFGAIFGRLTDIPRPRSKK